MLGHSIVMLIYDGVSSGPIWDRMSICHTVAMFARPVVALASVGIACQSAQL